MGILDGFMAALSFQNLIFALIGCILGTALGVLPGIGATAGIAILIPLTLGMDTDSAVIMLAAIFYGTSYGGTITSVLLNLPGEGETAITCIDGYQMTLRDRAGVALMIAGVGSFVGGTIATLGLTFAADQLAHLGLKIGPPEFFSLILIGVSLLVGLVGDSAVKGGISATLGMMIAMVGIDPVLGLPRFTFGVLPLFDGFGYVAVLVGLFGLGELLASSGGNAPKLKAPPLKELIPRMPDMKRAAPAIARGSFIGFFIGLIPGVTSAVSALVGYSTEKRVGKHKAEIGSGAIEGVAAPEAANNAHGNAAFVPLFTLGIPASPAIAVLMGAFLQHGLTPGPQLLVSDPLLVWTIIASMFIGNAMLLILNVPLVGLWTRILDIPYGILSVCIYVFIVIGSYAVNGSMFDVYVMIGCGVLGLLFRRYGIPVAPFILTLILAPFMERALRQSLQLSQGSFAIFVDRPLSLAFLSIAMLVILATVVNGFRGRRRVLMEDAEA